MLSTDIKRGPVHLQAIFNASGKVKFLISGICLIYMATTLSASATFLDLEIFWMMP